MLNNETYGFTYYERFWITYSKTLEDTIKRHNYSEWRGKS